MREPQFLSFSSIFSIIDNLVKLACSFSLAILAIVAHNAIRDIPSTTNCPTSKISHFILVNGILNFVYSGLITLILMLLITEIVASLRQNTTIRFTMARFLLAISHFVINVCSLIMLILASDKLHKKGYCKREQPEVLTKTRIFIVMNYAIIFLDIFILGTYLVVGLIPPQRQQGITSNDLHQRLTDE